MDVIVRDDVSKKHKSNFAGLEEDDLIGTAILNFDRDEVGQTLSEFFIE